MLLFVCVHHLKIRRLVMHARKEATQPTLSHYRVTHFYKYFCFVKRITSMQHISVNIHHGINLIMVMFHILFMIHLVACVSVCVCVCKRGRRCAIFMKTSSAFPVLRSYKLWNIRTPMLTFYPVTCHLVRLLQICSAPPTLEPWIYFTERYTYNQALTI